MKNFQLEKTIRELKKLGKKRKFWLVIANYLSKPTRERVIVNLNKINRIANEKDIIIVPGKVLGTGEITKKITIIAYAFSKSVIEKANNVELILLEEIIKDSNKATNLKNPKLII